MKKIGVIVAIIILILVLIKGNGEFLYFNDSKVTNKTTVQADDFNVVTQPESEVKIETGVFQGQIDNNFIEIKISGIPENKALRVFMLSEGTKATLEKLNIREGSDIKIQYCKNEDGQNVIKTIEKFSSGLVN